MMRPGQRDRQEPKPLDKARPTWTVMEYRPSAATARDGPGRCAHSYGSEAPANPATDRG